MRERQQISDAIDEYNLMKIELEEILELIELASNE